MYERINQNQGMLDIVRANSHSQFERYMRDLRQGYKLNLWDVLKVTVSYAYVRNHCTS